VSHPILGRNFKEKSEEKHLITDKTRIIHTCLPSKIILKETQPSAIFKKNYRLKTFKSM